jgi:Mn-dependent DtxR family transcriptional regulator
MLEAIVGLLGRLVFPEKELKGIVTKNKQDPGKYIKAYNLCDGEHGVTEIAKQVGVAQPTLTPILAKWKDRGIVYEVMKRGGKFYKKLFPI